MKQKLVKKVTKMVFGISYLKVRLLVDKLNSKMEQMKNVSKAFETGFVLVALTDLTKEFWKILLCSQRLG